MSLIAIALLALLLVDFTSGDECNVVVLTNNQLREEIRRQLSETDTESDHDIHCNKSMMADPENCTCTSLKEDISAKVESMISAVNNTLTEIRSEIANLTIPGYTPSHPACSCKEILQIAPQSPSGLYWIRGTDNCPKHVYCDMERNCKGVAGGWMRLASIDMTDPSHTCPSGLKTLTSPRRLCAMNINGSGCSSAIFPVQGVKYTQVCGKIIGYQQKTPDAFSTFSRGPKTTATTDSNYVDGISMTHGYSPRKHIWTFAAAAHEHNSGRTYVCPCTNTRNNPPPSVPGFVGNDYFCDTGSENHAQFIFYANDPLWDGAGCGQYSTCCTWNSPPWFRKQINSTSDDIEMRLCCDQNRSDEDITFEKLELYVQ